MRIDFGSVKKYFTERGFGFVGRTFLSARQDEVFFHIRNLKRSNPDLALKLSNEESVGDIYFWYGVEQTSKGEQVSIILNKNEIKEIEIDNFNQIIIRIETIWNNISSEIPDWLNEVTFDLLGHDKLNDLCTERLRSENQKKEADEVKKEKLIARRKAEEEIILRIREKERIQKEIEENEFQQLLEEIAKLGFNHSNQVSNYIVKNKLGYKYKNISGVIRMEQQDGSLWDFNGGFPTDIYAKLCRELGLKNRGSGARPVSFTAFKDI